VCFRQSNKFTLQQILALSVSVLRTCALKNIWLRDYLWLCITG
jgi:hypothetical protein